ncbi:MAG: hypothetical protein LBH00_08455 [Planctomycetaceae bacterium]|jgi:hypothetical protein|nr:hypothetical protein [Planctomycetaceae bacterium]
MKKIFSFAAVLLIAAGTTLCQAAELPASGDYDLDRESAAKAFNQLLEKAQKTPVISAVKGAVKFEAVSPVEVPVKLTAVSSVGGTVAGGTAGGEVISATAHVSSATKIWFELVNGGYVNPKTYKFAPGELVYVGVLASQPVSVTIYQKDESGEQRRKYPVEKFPSSFAVIQPGVPTRLPVLFQIDKDFKPENLSFVVANVSSPAICDQVRRTVEATQQERIEASKDAATSISLVASASIGSGTLSSGTLKADLQSAEAAFAAINTAGLEEKEYAEGTLKCRRVRFFCSHPVFVRPAYYTRYVSNPVSVARNNPVNALRITGDNNNVNYNVVNVNNASTVAGTPLTAVPAGLAANTISYHYQTVAVSGTAPAYLESRATYPNVEDVAFYLISENGVGQLPLTLEKTGANFTW